MARVNIGGEPGDTYTNDTGKVLYQFFADWVRTCGICAQYDSMIGSSWPIPIHRLCRCRQVAIWPGKTSRPFTDFREKIANLDPGQRAKVVGVANLQLIDAGVVKWEDVVTGQRVRDLREVVASKKLTVDRMTGAGVTRSVAERAYATVNTPAHELADQQRKELLQKVLDKGVTKEQLKQALGQRLAARVGVAGPGGAARMPVAPKVPKVPRAPRKKAPELVTTATRADYLKKARIKEDVAERIANEEAAAAARLKAEEAARLAAESAKKKAAEEAHAAELARLRAARLAAEEAARKKAEVAAKKQAAEAARAAELAAIEAARLKAEAAEKKKAEAAEKKKAEAAARKAEAWARTLAESAARVKADEAARQAEADRKLKATQAEAARRRAAADRGPAGTTSRSQVADRLRGIERPADRDAAVLALVRERQSAKTTTTRSLGMATPETFRTLEYEGSRYHFRDENPGPMVATLQRLGEAPPISRAIARHTADVYFTSQSSSDDPYWQKEFNNPDHHAAASGGVARTVVLYNDRPASITLLAHEMGHNLATAAYGSGGTIPPEGAFRQAWTSKEQPWTAYAKNSIDEDFAESVLEYVQQPGVMKTFRPLRYQAIEELVRQSDAGKF